MGINHAEELFRAMNIIDTVNDAFKNPVFKNRFYAHIIYAHDIKVPDGSMALFIKVEYIDVGSDKKYYSFIRNDQLKENNGADIFDNMCHFIYDICGFKCDDV